MKENSVAVNQSFRVFCQRRGNCKSIFLQRKLNIRMEQFAAKRVEEMAKERKMKEKEQQKR